MTITLTPRETARLIVDRANELKIPLFIKSQARALRAFLLPF